MERWVLRKACRQARKWHEERPDEPRLRVSVNVSARRFGYHTFSEEVGGVLRETGLDPSALELEITEVALMGNAKGTAATLTQLKSMGVRLAVGEFGTGYSSLSCLKHLPIDTLKIDRSIVDGVDQNPRHEEIVLAAVALAHSLGGGRGHETAGQLGRLKELGCDMGQGYHLGRPAPTETPAAPPRKP